MKRDNIPPRPRRYIWHIQTINTELWNSMTVKKYLYLIKYKWSTESKQLNVEFLCNVLWGYFEKLLQRTLDSQTLCFFYSGFFLMSFKFHKEFLKNWSKLMLMIQLSEFHVHPNLDYAANKIYMYIHIYWEDHQNCFIGWYLKSCYPPSKELLIKRLGGVCLLPHNYNQA